MALALIRLQHRSVRVGRIRRSRHPAEKPYKRPETICRMALTLIRPTTPLGLRMPEKAEPPSGRKTIQKAGNNLPDGAYAYPAYNIARSAYAGKGRAAIRQKNHTKGRKQFAGWRLRLSGLQHRSDHVGRIRRSRHPAKKTIKKAGNINLFPAFDLNGI